MYYTETYNGSSWTEVADLNSDRGQLGGAGTTTAALARRWRPILFFIPH